MYDLILVQTIMVQVSHYYTIIFVNVINISFYTLIIAFPIPHPNPPDRAYKCHHQITLYFNRNDTETNKKHSSNYSRRTLAVGKVIFAEPGITRHMSSSLIA